MTRTQYAIETEVGTLYLVASEKGLQSILFNKQKVPLITKLNSNNKIDLNLHTAAPQLKEYFSGKREKFDLKLDLIGT